MESGLELPAFSTFDAMASKIRREVNTAICDTDVWMDGVAAGKVTDFAGEADAADVAELRDHRPVKRLGLVACLVHKSRMRVRDDLATMFCKRVATKVKKAKQELEEIRLAEREIVEALIGNYRTVLKNIDEGAPAQAALDGLDETAPLDEVAKRLDGDVPPALLALAQAPVVQAGGLGAVTPTVEELGGFDKQYEQIEKVSAHHGNFWEVLLYGRIGRDRAVMFGLAEKLEFTATPEDGRALDALAHAQRHQAARGEYITAFDEAGREVDISFAAQNWRKAVLDKTRPGQFVRKHVEAMVFTALAEEPRTGDGGRLGGVRRLVQATARVADRAGKAGRLPGGGRPRRGGRDGRIRRRILPQAAGGQAAGRRRGGGRRLPGQRGPGHRPGDRHPLAQAAPLEGPAAICEAA
ncbi:hypothetical protein [Streptomyces sp. NPDC056937]|uniref:hypothetical protein n=1 Tax=Streptomyces sp. NPDC056937 TaxID=3345969 RepID=UPI003640ED39